MNGTTAPLWCKVPKFETIRNSLNLIGQFLGWVDSIAEQLKPNDRWTPILTVAFRKLLRLNPRRGPNPTLIPA